jgi:uncharacterized protein (TIGR03083 family)
MPAPQPSDPELEALAALRADIVRHEADDGVPPAGLLDGILGLALSRRPAGRPTGSWASEAIDGVESLRRTVADLALVLDGLAPSAWDLPATTANPHWTVADVVAHLVAGDRYIAGMLRATAWTPPAGTEHDHLAMTRPTIEELRSVAPTTLHRQWTEGSGTTLEAVTKAVNEGRLRQPLQFAGVPMSLATLLIVRTFEVWTHSEDIRRAVDLPLEPPDGSRLTLMSNIAVRALPIGLALAGKSHPGRTARVVLTGVGGGTWSQALNLGDQPGEPDLLLVADVVDFCRLAATRLSVEDLECHIEGDETLAADVLAGAGIFAA